ncbi:MAG: zinc ribbon domain-containing protein [Phycisphaerales bacterium]
MPTYDYRCGNCEHTFELFQKMSDAPKRKCPKCGRNALNRLIGTGGAVLFKGSGFYQTDYRSESYRKAAKAESGDGGSKSDASKAQPSSGEAKSSGSPKSGDMKPAASGSN